MTIMLKWMAEGVTHNANAIISCLVATKGRAQNLSAAKGKEYENEAKVGHG